ncbi:hypothetical protein ACTGJ9_020970 [Bradyrhizobium sp. RDM12]
MTGQDGKPVFVNLDTVTHVKADLHDGYVPSRGVTGRSFIEFVGGRGADSVSSIVVRETPEEILTDLPLR